MRNGLDKFRDDSPSVDGASLFGFLAVVLLSLGAFAYYGIDWQAESHTVSVFQPAGYHTLAKGDLPVGTIDSVETTSLNSQTDKPSASCNIDACSNAYRSFRVSDCTFQPYEGPRRLCTRK